jgi:CBS domain-containing protein
VDGLPIELDTQGRPGRRDAARSVRPDVLLRDVIAVRAATRAPVLVVGDGGRLAGIIDERDILRVLIRDGVGTPSQRRERSSP